MPFQPINLGMGSNPGRVGAISAARLINCYVENAGEEGKIRLPIVPIDSIEEWTTLPTSPIRGAVAVDDSTLYVVAGNTLYKVATNKGATAIGTVTVTGIVTMAANTAGQVSVATTTGFYYVSNGTTTALVAHSGNKLAGSDGNVVAATQMDGYHIVGLDNGEFYISTYQDADEFDNLDFETAEKNPDAINMVTTRATDLVIFGPKSTEFYSNTGNTDFPFERVTSSEFGLYAPGTVEKVPSPSGEGAADTLIFVASNSKGAYAGVVMMQGYQAVSISRQDLDAKIEAETSKTVIRAMSWTRRGHSFYALTGTDWTWCYDVATGQWHELQSPGLTYWRPKLAVQFGTTALLGDNTSGKIFNFDESLPTTLDSVVNIYTSNDNGDTYSAARSKTIGGVTAGQQRFIWNRLGISKEDGKVFKIEITNSHMQDGTGGTSTIIPPAVHAWPNRVQFDALRLDVTPATSKTELTKAVTGMAVDMTILEG